MATVRSVISVMRALAMLAPFLILAGCDKLPPQVDDRGEQWYVYTAETTPLADNSINAIAVDRTRTVWFATDDGVSKLREGVGWTTYRKEMEYLTYSGISRKANAVAIGYDGSAWFGLAGGGIRRHTLNSRKSPWLTYKQPVIPSEYINSMAIFQTGELWAATSVGACRFTPGPDRDDPTGGIWRAFNLKNSLIPPEPVRCVAVDPGEVRVWFGTQRFGVISYDGDADWTIDTPVDQPSPVLSMAFDPGRIAWFGIFAGWAYRYSIETAEWSQVSDTTFGGGLPDNFVNAIATDRAGTVWFGTLKGLARYSGGAWTIYTEENSPLPDDNIRALALDPSGNLWIGTANGAAVHNPLGVRL